MPFVCFSIFCKYKCHQDAFKTNQDITEGIWRLLWPLCRNDKLSDMSNQTINYVS